MRKFKTLLVILAMLPVIASAQGVNQRQREQHRRIEQGIHQGTLNRKEAGAIRAREAALRARERRDRSAHHGRLTLPERHRLNRSQSRLSHQIYRQKHDRQHRP